MTYIISNCKTQLTLTWFLIFFFFFFCISIHSAKISLNDLLCKSMEWFLCDKVLRHERVKIHTYGGLSFLLFLDFWLNPSC